MSHKGAIMGVVDKINYLLMEKNMTKRDFAKRLIRLEPRLERTGKSPSESTIYGYLNGGREVKVELIPYIAEVLEVSEQELFNEEIEYSSDYNIRRTKDVREILRLLQYAPKNAVDEIRQYLLKYEAIYKQGL